MLIIRYVILFLAFMSPAVKAMDNGSSSNSSSSTDSSSEFHLMNHDDFDKLDSEIKSGKLTEVVIEFYPLVYEADHHSSKLEKNSHMRLSLYERIFRIFILLRENKNIRSLTLKRLQKVGQKVDSLAIRSLARTIKMNKTIEILDMSDSVITETSAKILAKGLIDNTSIIALKLPRSTSIEQVTRETIESILTVNKNRKEHERRRKIYRTKNYTQAKNHIASSSSQASDGSSGHFNLNTLPAILELKNKIQEGKLTSNVVIDFNPKNLSNLNLWQYQTLEFFKKLGEHRNFGNLTIKNLREHRGDDDKEVVTALAEMIKKNHDNPKFKMLNLSGSTISEAGAGILCSAIKHNRNITVLILPSGPEISTSMKAEIEAVLAANFQQQIQ